MQDAESVGAVPCHVHVDQNGEVVRRRMDEAFMGTEVSYELPEVAWKGGTPPFEPNVYSDASIAHPEIPWLAHAGFGILFKDAAEEADELDANQPWGTVRRDGTGAYLAQPAYGRRVNSVRVELQAGLAALQDPYPVHLATDSKAMEVRHRALLKRLPFLGDKQLCMMVNGDLWGMWVSTLRARGADTVAVRWIPSHTDRAAAGKKRPITAAGFAGNAVADALAAEGRRAHCPDALAAVGPVHARYMGYMQLTQDIHAMAVAILRKASDLRHPHGPFAKLGPKAKLLAVTVPEYVGGEPFEMRRLVAGASCPRNARHPAAASVVDYLLRHSWRRATTGSGLTWLELLVHYELWMRRPFGLRSGSPATPALKVTLEFRRLVVAVVRAFFLMRRRPVHS